jgi:hypothetical protein
MGERTLRGSRLGSMSYETDRDTDLAPRLNARYTCPEGHDFEVVFAEGAEVPCTWDCQRHGVVAKAVEGVPPEAKKVKPVRTHWDMLLERRSLEELSQVLEERLVEVREGRAS